MFESDKKWIKKWLCVFEGETEWEKKNKNKGKKEWIGCIVSYKNCWYCSNVLNLLHECRTECKSPSASFYLFI